MSAARVLVTGILSPVILLASTSLATGQVFESVGTRALGMAGAFVARQDQVRAQLSLTLQGIVCQTLVPRADGSGQVAAVEVLVPTVGVRNLIRESKVHQLYSAMQTGSDQAGMQTMNQALAGLCARRAITIESALDHSPNPTELEEILQRRSAVRRPDVVGVRS